MRKSNCGAAAKGGTSHFTREVPYPLLGVFITALVYFTHAGVAITGASAGIPDLLIGLFAMTSAFIVWAHGRAYRQRR